MAVKGKRLNWQRITPIIRKEIVHIKRDRPSLMMAIMMPIMMLLLFGYAVNLDVDHISTAVFDQSMSQESREFTDALRNSNYFDLVYHPKSFAEIRDLMASGKISAAVVFPPGYAESLRRGETAQVQIIIDGSDPTPARTSLSTAQLIAMAKDLELKNKGLAATEGRKMPGIDLRPRVWYNPNMESEKFNIPALIGLIMQNITTMLTAFALVREKEKGTMEQLMVTPVRPLELIIGKLVPYVFIGFFSFLTILLLGWFWFGVAVQGNLLLLVTLAILFLICTLGIGLLISTVARTQLQAMQMTMLFILPSILLSGFVFPRETMPVVIKFLGSLIPLTYFLKILRGIYLKEAQLSHLFQDVVTLSVFALVIVILASLRFRKKLD